MGLSEDCKKLIRQTAMRGYLFAGFQSAWKSLQNAVSNFLTFNEIFWYLVFQIYKARTLPNAHPELHAAHNICVLSY
jgi:hypothetical protein